MTDTIAELQAAIVTLLTTTATDLTGLTVVTSDDLRALDKINTALAGVGLCAVVITPDLEFTDPCYYRASITIRIIENPMANRGNAGTSYAGSWWAIHIGSWCWLADVGAAWDFLHLKSITQDQGTEETLWWVIQLETSGAFKTEADPAPIPPETPPPS